MVLLGLNFFGLPKTYSQASVVHLIQLDDATINPVTAQYIMDSIDGAYEAGAQCLIIKMDTPGGLLTSTRSIVKKMLTSKIPIVVYIAPSGSRAGSAGVFITYASHIAAMAPSTNIGAAHPVELGKEQPKHQGEWDELRGLIDELKENQAKGKDADKKSDSNSSTPRHKADDNPMESKILEDTTAFIRAIAKERHRNEEWAVASVTQSASITDTEAIEKGVVELIATSDEDLLQKLDGRSVQIGDETVTLSTKNAEIKTDLMDSRQQFFNILANPTIAYIFMILGFYGLLYEITHPGFGLPGVLGVIFLILAFYSMQTLPTNYAGLALMIFGLILLVSEAFVPSFGLLAVGGVVCLILGSLLLFQSTDPVMRVSLSAIFGLTLTTTAITLFLMRSVIRAHRAQVLGGREGLVGVITKAETAIVPGKKGRVHVHGEIWNAISADSIQPGDEVEVIGMDGLILKIKKR